MTQVTTQALHKLGKRMKEKTSFERTAENS